MNRQSIRYFIDQKAFARLVDEKVGDKIGDERKKELKKLEAPILKNIKLIIKHCFTIDKSISWVFQDGTHRVINTSSSSKFLYALEAYGLINAYCIDAVKIKEYLLTRNRDMVKKIDPMADSPYTAISEELVEQNNVVKIDQKLCTNRAKIAVSSHFSRELFRDIANVIVSAPLATDKKKTQFIVTGVSNSGKTTILNAFIPMGVAKPIIDPKFLVSSDPSPYTGADLDNQTLIFDDTVPTDKLYKLNGTVMISPKGKMVETANIGAMFFSLADIAKIGERGVDKQQLNRMSIINVSDGKTLNESFKGIPMEETEEVMRLFALEAIREAKQRITSVSEANIALSSVCKKYSPSKELKSWDDMVKEEIDQSLEQGSYQSSYVYKNNKDSVIETTEHTDSEERAFFIARPKQTLMSILKDINQDLAPNMGNKTLDYIIGVLGGRRTSRRVIMSDGRRVLINGIEIRVKNNHIVNKSMKGEVV